MEKESANLIPSLLPIQIMSEPDLDTIPEDFSQVTQPTSFKPALKKNSKLIFILQKIVHNYFFAMFYWIFLIYFLFSKDLRLYFSISDKYNSFLTFFNILSIILIIFTSFFFLITNRTYWRSMFFLTDLFILSLCIIDIPIVRQSIFTNDSTNQKWSSQILFFVFGTIRLASINKFIQFWYLPKYFFDFSGIFELINQSNCSLQGSGQAIRKLAMNTVQINLIFLSLIFIFYLFNSSLFSSASQDLNPAVKVYQEMLANNYTLGINYLKNELPNLFNRKNLTLVNLTISTNTTIILHNYSDYITEELVIWNSDIIDSFQIKIVYSIRHIIKIESLLLIIRNLIVLLLYLLFVVYNDWIFHQYIFEPYTKLNERMASKNNQFTGISRTLNKDCYVIENESSRIKQILIRGFGKAAEMLLADIFTLDGSLDFNSFKNTRFVHAIFGFCDIRRFTDVSEVLGKNVITFVNTIAEIVHSEVVRAGGGLNKNVGDAFLVLWILETENSNVDFFTLPDASEEEIHRRMHVGHIFRRNKQSDSEPVLTTIEQAELLAVNKIDSKNAQIAKLALISMLKIMLELIVNEDIQKINNSPEIKAKLPDFKVKIGFGLHAGKAIEGGLGSFYKLDMAYIGQAVSLSMLLESLTKEFLVPILFTQSILNLVNSTQIRDICREVRSLKLQPQNCVHRLYTVDVYPERLLQVQENTRKLFLPVSEVDSAWESVLQNRSLVSFLGLDFGKCRREQRIFDFETNKIGISAYLQGNWKLAKRAFGNITFLKDDQLALLKEMEKLGFVCPEGYQTMKLIEV